jgi:glycosyltransferase involved in cell wall biosynthesis
MPTVSDLVSVIMPTYNRASFLRRAIPCVLAQTHRNVELIVIDDGSSDDTPAVLQEYADRIVVIRQNHEGVSIARNAGMLAARGEYLAFLDSDDYWAEDMLERQLQALHAHPDAAVSYTWYTVVDTEGNVIRAIQPTCEGDVFDDLYFSNALITSIVIAKRSCFVEDGVLKIQFQPGMKIAEDHKVRLELALHYRFCNVPAFLGYITQHPGSTHSTYQIDEMVACMTYLEDFLWNHERAAPRLRTYEGKARASWSTEIAYLYLLAKGRKHDAWRYLWKAFRHSPFYLKPYLVMGGVVLGKGTTDRVMRFLHKLKPGLPSGSTAPKPAAKPPGR